MPQRNKAPAKMQSYSNGGMNKNDVMYGNVNYQQAPQPLLQNDGYIKQTPLSPNQCEYISKSSFACQLQLIVK